MTLASNANYSASTNSVTGCLTINSSGNATFSGAVKGSTVQATSDIRLKEDLEEKHYDLSSLKTYRYKFKDKEGYHVGLIAQEVEKVIPEAISEGDDKYLSLDYNAVVAALVDEVNQLKERINKLEGKN